MRYAPGLGWLKGPPTVKLIRNTVLLGLALILGAQAPVEAQHFPTNEELRLMLRDLVEDGQAPGIVLGVLEADGSTRIVSFGSAGPDAHALGPRSVFEVGSVNKTFTASLLSVMVARGEVALEDPVSKYLPEHVTVPSRGGREITLIDLATHRSGLPGLPENYLPPDMANPWADYTIETMYAFLSSHTLRRDPGAEFEYSNLGFGLLGHVLAQAAGRSYRGLLRERILEPLGMDMAGYALEGEVAEWMVKGHSAGGDVVPYWFGTEAIDGAGGLRANVEDMLSFLKANVGPANTDLERALREAHRVRRPIQDDPVKAGSGLGWQVLLYEDRRVVTHGGGTGGFRTRIGFDPDLGVGFVRLTNAAGFEYDIGLELLRRAAEDRREGR